MSADIQLSHTRIVQMVRNAGLIKRACFRKIFHWNILFLKIKKAIRSNKSGFRKRRQPCSAKSGARLAAFRPQLPVFRFLFPVPRRLGSLQVLQVDGASCELRVVWPGIVLRCRSRFLQDVDGQVDSELWVRAGGLRAQLEGQVPVPRRVVLTTGKEGGVTGERDRQR